MTIHETAGHIRGCWEVSIGVPFHLEPHEYEAALKEWGARGTDSLRNMTPPRPALRYFGGKWRIAPWVISHFPRHQGYVESFGGAGSVLLQKEASTVEVWNDLASEMVNLFRVLRDPTQCEELIHLLHLTPYSREEWLSCYELSDDPVEQARRTVALYSMSHNPSCVQRREANAFRSSIHGLHRLPHDFQGTIENLHAVAQRMRGVIIEHRPAVQVMKQYDADTTLHYLDPPYLQTTRRRSRKGYKYEMLKPEEHEIMLTVALSLTGMVVISGYPSELYDDYLSTWKRVRTDAQTGSTKAGETLAEEVLWLNPACVQALRRDSAQLSLF